MLQRQIRTRPFQAPSCRTLGSDAGVTTMADRAWYRAVSGKQEGPYSDEQFRALITSGQVTADTLVWSAPMTGWNKAGDVPGLMPGAPRSPQALALGDGGQAGPALVAHVGTWGLF